MSFPPFQEPRSNNDITVRLQHGNLLNNTDGLNLLADTAVGSGPVLSRKSRRVEQTSDYSRTPHPSDDVPEHPPTPDGQQSMKYEDLRIGHPYGFQLTDETSGAVRMWNKVRFVRAGWFTALEALRYMDFFYTSMLPLTPITLPDFQDPSTHDRLLREEPMLAATILTIASRHIMPPGRGANLRGHTIHRRLWEHLQSMICCMFLGQDCFEQGNPRLQPQRSQEQPVLGLRTLGAIESLLLLTEWQPTTIHFPSHDFSNGILVEDDSTCEHNTNHGSGHTWFDEASDAASSTAWLTSGNRSNAMTWSFLGTALNLAYEHGLFNLETMANTHDAQRVDNLRRLLYVYLVQTSGRLSIPAMITEDQWSKSIYGFNDTFHAFRKTPPQLNGNDPEEHAKADRTYMQEGVLHFWFRIGRLFNRGNNTLWPSHSRTRQIVQQGNYGDILDDLACDHEEWLREFRISTLISAQARCILDIEYYYMRVHGNAVALQAIVERCVNILPEDSTKVIPREVLEGCMGDDRRYINMIADDSKCLLHCVIDGLHRHGHLAHVPNRTFWRIANVSTILLKTLALGTYLDHLEESLDLIDGAAQVLADDAVDELHIATNLAELLLSMTARMRLNMIRAPIQSQSNGDAATASDQRGQSIPAPSQSNYNGNTQASGCYSRVGSPTFPPLKTRALSTDITNYSPGSFSDRRFGRSRPSPPSQTHNLPLPTPVPTFEQPHEVSGHQTVRPPRSVSQASPYPFGPPASLMPPPVPMGPDQRADIFNPVASNNTHADPASKYDPIATSQGINSMISGMSPRAMGGWETLCQSPRFLSPGSTGQDWFGLNMASLGGRGMVRPSAFGPVIDGADMLDLVSPYNAPNSANPNGVPPDWGSFHSTG